MTLFKTTLLVIFGSLAFAMNAYGQERGSIAGTITDSDTGETIPGVNVIVRGTTFGASTDFDGEYIIRNIRPGDYTIEVAASNGDDKVNTLTFIEGLVEKVRFTSQGVELLVNGVRLPLGDVEEIGV